MKISIDSIQRLKRLIHIMMTLGCNNEWNIMEVAPSRSEIIQKAFALKREIVAIYGFGY